jgi:LPS-assembly lipoprotein
MTLFTRSISMISLCCALAACGFQLRGANEFSYKTLYISGQTQINKALKKSFTTNGVQIVDNANEAEVQLELLKEQYEKRILSLGGDGLVKEYELFYRVHYRTKSIEDPIWAQPLTMEVRRDLSYTDKSLLGKEIEERRLIEDMHNQVVRNLMRRLSTLKK